MHRLRHLPLPLVETGVVQCQPGPPRDLLQQGQIGGRERVRAIGAAQSQCTQHVPEAADRADDGGLDPGGREEPALFHGEFRVRLPPIGLGSRERGRGAPQRTGERKLGLLRHRRHGPDEVLLVPQVAVLGVDDDTTPHPARLGDEVDDGPVRQPRHQQTHQSVQDLLDVHRRGQLGGQLREQRQALQLGQGLLQRTGLRVVQRVKERQRAPSAARVVSGDQPGHRGDRTVAPLEPERSALRRAARQDGLPDRALASRFGLAEGVPMQRVMRVPPEQFHGVPAEKLLGHRVDGGDDALLVGQVCGGGQ